MLGKSGCNNELLCLSTDTEFEVNADYLRFKNGKFQFDIDWHVLHT